MWQTWAKKFFTWLLASGKSIQEQKPDKKTPPFFLGGGGCSLRVGNHYVFVKESKAWVHQLFQLHHPKTPNSSSFIKGESPLWVDQNSVQQIQHWLSKGRLPTQKTLSLKAWIWRSLHVAKCLQSFCPFFYDVWIWALSFFNSSGSHGHP